MLDVIIIAVVVAAAVMGFRKGFIGQLGSVAAIIIGVVACRLFGPQVTDMIMPAGQGPEVNSMSKYAYSILAYAGVYIVAYYAVILVARLLRTVTHTLLLGPLDRMAGAVVSIVKWLLALSVALNLYAIIVSGSDLGSRSRLGKETVQFIMEIAPAAWGGVYPKLSRSTTWKLTNTITTKYSTTPRRANTSMGSRQTSTHISSPKVSMRMW